MKKTTQNHKILRLLQHGSVTPLRALSQAGCLRLAARIHELRAVGHSIRTDYITRRGKTYARYSLEQRR
jgi:hypothetical protein